MTITVANTVIQGKRITGQLNVRAPGFKMIDCVLTSNGFWGVDGDASNVGAMVISGSKIAGNSSGGNSAILGAGSFTNNDLSGFDNGIALQGNNCVIKGNYIHDLGGSAQAHVDGIQLAGPHNTVLIEDNKVVAWDTSCIFIKPDAGPISNVTVNHNLLLNQAGKQTAATAYSVPGGSNPAPTGTKFTNNVMQRGHWFYWSIEGSVVRSGNVDYLTGASVDNPAGEGQAR